MPLYRVSFHGENFAGVVIGSKAPVGFYSTRLVEAASSEEATQVARAVLEADPTLRRADGWNAAASVLIEAVVEVHPATDRTPNNGFTFYLMGT